MNHRHRGIHPRPRQFCNIRKVQSRRRVWRLPRSKRTMYMYQLIMKGFGTVYAFSGTTLLETDHLVRMKFRGRRRRARTGWNVDLSRFACYGYRRKHIPGFFRQHLWSRLYD